MRIEKTKFLRFLKDGYVTVFIYELENGLNWRIIAREQATFINALDAFRAEIQKVREP